jgi:2-dehydropantoate 2-reductase
VKVVVLGAGAVGCYVGGLLSLAGLELVFAARPAVRDAIAARGVRLSGPRGDFHAPGVTAIAHPDEAIGVDLVLSCVKLYDARASAEAWRPMLESAAGVICLQNGVDGVARVGAGAPQARCWGGLAMVAGRLREPGVVEYVSDMSSIVFGGPGAKADPVLAAFVAQVRAATLPTPFELRRVEDIARPQWTKFLALATNAALTCLTRSPAGVVYRDAALLALARRSIGEVLAVARAEGVPLDDADADAALALLRGLPAGMVASMHHDLVAGRRLELDGLSGAVARLGRVHGIPTPFHDFAWACLKPHADGHRS